MKTTFVSSLAMQNAVRLAVQRAQAEIADSQVEITTGRHADVGLALGSKTARTISLNRDVARLDSILDNNALVSQRLSVSQDALGQMSDSAQTVLETLITVKGSEDPTQIDVAQRELEGALGSFISLANMSSSGEFLFAGINTDVRPMQDYFAEDAPAKQAFDDALQDFLAAEGVADANDLSAAQLENFLTGTVAPMFMAEDGEWEANWSHAADDSMSSRITNSEIIDSSATANAAGFRKFAMTAVVGMEMMGMNLNSEARAYLGEALTEMAGDSIAGIDAERTQLGVSQARVAKADDALADQKNVISTYIGELEGIDPYETYTRMTTLLTQMEASYALTARIQQLSLMNYL